MQLHPGSHDEYDKSRKARVPAWTDRILCKDCPEIELQKYTCDEQIVASDHLPVYAIFQVAPAEETARLQDKPGAESSGICTIS